jgi:tetratricopeptide (TPR) repeat protein
MGARSEPDDASPRGVLPRGYGRSGEAVTLLQKIRQLDPLSPLLGNDLGWAYYYLRRPADAIAQQRKTLEIDPGFPLAHIGLGVAYEQHGELSAAAAEYTKARDLARLAGLNARRGDIVGATALRKELERKARQEYVDPLAFTILCIGIGDKEAAAGWLEQAYENRSAGLIWLNADQVYEPLRSDARFQNVRRAVGLPE